MDKFALIGKEAEIEDIITAIEGIPCNHCGNKSRFSLEDVSWDNLSAGCKTAIVALYKSLSSEKSYVDLSEPGPVALRKTLEILDRAPNVIGVVRQPLDLARYYTAFELNVNDQYDTNWIAVLAEQLNLCTSIID